MRIKVDGIKDQDVLKVLDRVPRDEFVLNEYLSSAYDNIPLPIGYGQTISQPYIVALMTELLELKKKDKVLEIGTGSGYQAAVLAELVREVYTVEIIKPLAERAQKKLAALGYKNIHIKTGDGYFGWEENAPFDAIIVTAAPGEIPASLQQQLAEGGRLVVPVGPSGTVQTLWKYTKKDDSFLIEDHGLVRFVPFTRE